MDIPPKPSKNAQNIILIDIFLIGIFAIIDTPFVSSIIPDKTPVVKLLGMLKRLNIGSSISDNTIRIPVFLRIDIITLKSITNPPIITIVETEDMILFCKILPKELNLGGILVSFFETEWKTVFFSPRISFPKSK